MRSLIYILLALNLGVVHAQTAVNQKNMPKVPSNTLVLPPPPPVMMDKDLQTDLRASRKLDAEKRTALVEHQKDLDKQVTPLTNEQIKHIQQRSKEIERLENGSDTTTPKKFVTREVTWSVGSPSIHVNMAPGFTTTILFFDPSGKPLPLAPTGALVGDKEAIEANVTGHAITLTVLKPWKMTNLTSFLMNVPVPAMFNLTSERDGSKEIVEQLRVRMVDASANAYDMQQDSQNMSALSQLANGTPTSLGLTVLPIISTEKGDPARLKWTVVANNVAQFKADGNGKTYVILRPGYKLLYPHVPNGLASMSAPDGTEAYIIGGNNPRVFTLQDANGALYRITIQR